MEKILVGGGSGFIGKHLIPLLRLNGFQVINITRKSKSKEDIEWSEIKRNGLPSGVKSVVNLAGYNIMSFVRFNEEFKTQVISSRVDTTRILASAINQSENPPQSFIASSAIGYYGYTDKGVTCDELSPPGNDFLSDLCIKWESAADEMTSQSTRLVKIRIGLVLGRDGGIIQNMYPAFYMGAGGPIGNGKQWFPWVHIDDMTGMILHAIKTRDASGVLNGVAPELVTNYDFSKTLASAMCRPAIIPLPVAALSMIYGTVRANMMSQSPKIKPTRTIASGYQYIYPSIKEACNKIVNS